MAGTALLTICGGYIANLMLDIGAKSSCDLMHQLSSVVVANRKGCVVVSERFTVKHSPDVASGICCLGLPKVARDSGWL